MPQHFYLRILLFPRICRATLEILGVGGELLHELTSYLADNTEGRRPARTRLLMDVLAARILAIFEHGQANGAWENPAILTLINPPPPLSVNEEDEGHNKESQLPNDYTAPAFPPVLGQPVPPALSQQPLFDFALPGPFTDEAYSVKIKPNSMFGPANRYRAANDASHPNSVFNARLLPDMVLMNFDADDTTTCHLPPPLGAKPRFGQAAGWMREYTAFSLTFNKMVNRVNLSNPSLANHMLQFLNQVNMWWAGSDEPTSERKWVRVLQRVIIRLDAYLAANNSNALITASADEEAEAKVRGNAAVARLSPKSGSSFSSSSAARPQRNPFSRAKFYCSFPGHGHNTSHDTKDCRSMARQADRQPKRPRTQPSPTSGSSNGALPSSS